MDRRHLRLFPQAMCRKIVGINCHRSLLRHSRPQGQTYFNIRELFCSHLTSQQLHLFIRLLGAMALRHWQFGRRVECGPDYDNFGSQLESPTLVRALIVEPDDLDLRCWAKMCCQVPPYEDQEALEGWSPGRSVVVELEEGDGTKTSYYYKLYDGPSPSLCDIAPHPSPGQLSDDPAGWRKLWEKFVTICLHCELGYLIAAHGLDMFFFEREIGSWGDTLCVEFSAAVGRPVDAGNAQMARRELLAVSQGMYKAAISRRASLLDARVFQVYPELVVEYIAQRRQSGRSETPGRFLPAA